MTLSTVNSHHKRPITYNHWFFLNKQMIMHKQRSFEQRHCINIARMIARDLKVSQITISCEIKRNSDQCAYALNY